MDKNTKVSANFKIKEFNCTCPICSVQENIDIPLNPYVVMYCQALRDGLNELMSFYDSKYNAKVAQVTVTPFCGRCDHKHAQMLAAYKADPKTYNKPAEHSYHRRYSATDPSCMYKGKKVPRWMILFITQKIVDEGLIPIDNVIYRDYEYTTRHVHISVGM